MREEPLCPLCGARSTWVRFRDRTHDERPDLRRRFPAECSSCRNEDRIHWKRWWQGIDMSIHLGEWQWETATARRRENRTSSRLPPRDTRPVIPGRTSPS